MLLRDKIALRLFSAIISRSDFVIDLYPKIGQKQIEICFKLADVFLEMSEKEPNDKT